MLINQLLWIAIFWSLTQGAADDDDARADELNYGGFSVDELQDFMSPTRLQEELIRRGVPTNNAAGDALGTQYDDDIDDEPLLGEFDAQAETGDTSDDEALRAALHASASDTVLHDDDDQLQRALAASADALPEEEERQLTLARSNSLAMSNTRGNNNPFDNNYANNQDDIVGGVDDDEALLQPALFDSIKTSSYGSDGRPNRTVNNPERKRTTRRSGSTRNSNRTANNPEENRTTRRSASTRNSTSTTHNPEEPRIGRSALIRNSTSTTNNPEEVRSLRRTATTPSVETSSRGKLKAILKPFRSLRKTFGNFFKVN